MMDETRFKMLYDQTSGPLLSYILRVTGEKATADDVFQEAYIRMLQHETDVDLAKHKAYLFATATNLIRDHWRRVKRERRWEEEGAVQTSRGANEIDLRYGVEEALQGMSPQQRSLLWLAYVEGYRHDEIASMLKLREKSVRVLLYRARRKLSEICRSMGIHKEEVQ